MSNWISVSIRIYRTLLRLYPISFHTEYETELIHVFRDLCRAGYNKHGVLGLAGVWAESVPDLFVNVIDEHIQEKFQMARTAISRILALSGVIGGVVWVLFGVMLFITAPEVTGSLHREVDDLAPAILLGAGLGSAGLLGVYLHAQGWPASSKFALLLAVAGGLWVIFSLPFTTNAYISLAGFLGQIASLILAGIPLLASPSTRRWAVLLIALAAAMFMFHTEDWRTLFGAAAGIFTIEISTRILRESVPSRVDVGHPKDKKP